MKKSSLSTTLAVACATLAGCATPPPQGSSLGVPTSLGNGSVITYAESDPTGAPKSIGVMFSASALQNLPSVTTDGHHCYPSRPGAKIDPGKDCEPTHEFVLPLPSDVARQANMPFKWVLLNWNPVGHLPPGIYDTPHFDVHFMIEPIQNIFAITAGPCGDEKVRCDQFTLGRKPLPANYVPPANIDVGAVVPAMGNHLLDVSGPEFKGNKFQHTMIFGAYDGRVTFYEAMVDRAWFLSKPSICTQIVSPEAVAVTGYYPTQTCMRYQLDKDVYTVSLEGFAMRQASPPGPLRPVPPLPTVPPPMLHHM